MADQDPAEQNPERRAEESDWQRRKRLAEVFGDVLPETTSDEHDDDADGGRESAGDRWLKSQVPPHHG